MRLLLNGIWFVIKLLDDLAERFPSSFLPITSDDLSWSHLAHLIDHRRHRLRWFVQEELYESLKNVPPSFCHRKRAPQTFIPVIKNLQHDWRPLNQRQTNPPPRIRQTNQKLLEARQVAHQIKRNSLFPLTSGVSLTPCGNIWISSEHLRGSDRLKRCFKMHPPRVTSATISRWCNGRVHVCTYTWEPIAAWPQHRRPIDYRRFYRLD